MVSVLSRFTNLISLSEKENLERRYELSFAVMCEP